MIKWLDNKKSHNLKNDRLKTNALHWPLACMLVIISLIISSNAYSGAREQAKRLHDRIAGVPPTASTLDEMTTLIQGGNAEAAAEIAIEHPDFYNVTLKNLAAPWTNEEQTVFTELNDYIATFIGTVRDDYDLREMFYADRLYIGSTNLGLPVYANSNNDHYRLLEEGNYSLKDNLTEVSQSSQNGLPSEATAGIFTTRAAAKAYFIAGTNRAMLRFALLNHLCHDMEQLKDPSLPVDRIRQDVSRSPGGDSRIFMNNCVGCHTGMDPLAQAYAYYDYSYDTDNDPEGLSGALSYNQSGTIDEATGSRVKAKYHINENTFPLGFVTPDDRWDNYWRQGKNRFLGWSDSLQGSGNGAKSLGQELAHSEAFASCQVEHAFTAMCLRPPANEADRTKLAEITTSFKSNNFNYKRAFIESAVYCMGE